MERFLPDGLDITDEDRAMAQRLYRALDVANAHRYMGGYSDDLTTVDGEFCLPLVAALLRWGGDPAPYAKTIADGLKACECGLD